MLKSIEQLTNLDFKEKWVCYLYNTNKRLVNYERVSRIKDLDSKLTYNYVLRTLNILQDNINNYSKEVVYLVEETLKWCEVAKCGDRQKIKKWKTKGYNLHVHNIGSADIYKEDSISYNNVVRVLIKTHGLIGQYIRGEIVFSKNRELYDLIINKEIDKNVLKEVLDLLNKCVIGSVSTDLYDRIKDQIDSCIKRIINGEFKEEIDIMKRISLLNHGLTQIETNELKDLLKNKKVKERLVLILSKLEFWYYEAALNDFSIIEQVKILLIVSNYIKEYSLHLSFEKVMNMIYIDYQDKKEINIYEKRIIESYLDSIEIDSILHNNIKVNPHINLKVMVSDDNLLPKFRFSIQASKLIDFCEVAYISDTVYNKAVFMLYDLFGFRRDSYDRFYNEINYLNTMNKSINQKAIILDYIVGKNILDVGPGGGALMDLILENDASLNVNGIDISANVIDSLNKRKKEEHKLWHVIKGDALHLEKKLKANSMDTVIYSSIIHELYSYIEYNGKKFNHDVIIETLKGAYNILKKNGRIIIRDGIMSEPIDEYRIIEFNKKDDLKILQRYCRDFKGRKITYDRIDDNKVKMLVNDAMEFLYTYTWGEDSYALEVHEQFGYFTPSEYVKVIKENLPNCKILLCNAFLQTGYEENLLSKISIYDVDMNIVKLPNSTCVIVIEKG